MELQLGSLIHADLASIKSESEGLEVLPNLMPGGAGAAGGHVAFGDSLRDAVHGVDAKDHAASDQMAAVESGRSDDLVGAMLASQDASLSFSMLMQVRNKVMGAVDELSKLSL